MALNTANLFPRSADSSASFPKPCSTIVFLDPVEMAKKIEQTLPVLAADEDFIEREANLNCLGYASAELRNLLGCFFELGRRDIVARFVSVCKSAATLSLESRIRSVAGALRIALERVNEVSGGKYVDLQRRIVINADRDARPPKKSEHWAFLEPGHDPDFMGIALTEQLDDLLSAATEVMYCLDWQQ